MSTEINVRVDRELLLQRDRVQRQAQRQFVLEKNGQKLVANRSQELVAASGATGGENRIRSVRTGTSTSTQAVPITPVTAPYQRQPLPQLGGAAGGIVSREGSYLALPVPYGPYSFTASDTNNQQYTLIGNKVARNGGPEDRYVAVYDTRPSPEYPVGSPNSWRPVVTDGLWTVQADSYYRDYKWTTQQGDLSYPISGLTRELEIGRAVDIANVENNQLLSRKPLRQEAFTIEVIARSGSCTIVNDPIVAQAHQINYCKINILNASIIITHLAVEARVNEFFGEPIQDPFTYFGVSFYFYDSGYGLTPHKLAKGRTANTAGVPNDFLLDGYSELTDLYGDTDVVISDASGSLGHVALVYDGTYFYCYWQGQRLAKVNKSALGITGRLGHFVENDSCTIDSFIDGYTPYGRTPFPTGPVVTPAIKCIRVTTNQALYTSESFTPPTSITRLA